MTDIIGFTGGRLGLTHAQNVALLAFLLGVKPDTVLHGGCCGGDATCHNMVVRSVPSVLLIHVYPGVDFNGRSPYAATDLLQESDATDRRLIIMVDEPQPYATRNARIAQDCALLVACPGSEAPNLRRGGTWQTVRLARAMDKPRIIIYPSGDLSNDNDP